MISRETSFLLPVECGYFRFIWAIVDARYLNPSRLHWEQSSTVCYCSCSGGSMSQARVTDFFSQRKSGTACPVKAAKPRSRGSSALNTGVTSKRTRSVKNEEALLCSSSVHEEFVRLIEEAAGPNHEESAGSNAATRSPPSPRTPKRTSADAEFDLGASVFSATADHSTAKKKRQEEAAREAAAPERPKRRTARKKLVLPQDSPQVQPEWLCSVSEPTLLFLWRLVFIVDYTNMAAEARSSRSCVNVYFYIK